MRGHRHCSWSRNVGDDRFNRGDAAWPSGRDRRRRGDGARGRHRASDSNDSVRNHARRVFTSGGVLRLLVFVALAAFLLYYVGPRNIAADVAQGCSRRRADGGGLGRCQPPLRPGVRPLDPLQHHHRCGARLRRLLRRRVERLAQDARRQPGAALRLRACSTPSPDGARGRSTSTALLWGLIGGAALGLVMFLLSAPRQRLARLPLADGRVHRFRAAHRLRPRRFGVAGARLGQAPGLCGRRRRACSG